MERADFLAWLRGLQGSIVQGLEACERAAASEAGAGAAATFLRDAWTKEPGAALSGEGLSCILEGGRVFERAGVLLSYVEGPRLPPSATSQRPELAGRPFVAMGVSLVIHPLNPYVPTSHMNVRTLATQDGAAWWVGGGFDLTPYYPVDEDILHWHRTAERACAPFGDGVYPTLKQRCDEYFVLKHRNETRGVGGLFVDDLTESTGAADAAAPNIGGRERCFALIRSIGEAFAPAYLPIVERRRTQPFGDRERAFQLYRRGRYVEFNLVFDRGTHFGLQSGGRTESILASMPPMATWRYAYTPEAGTPEARLADYLRPRDWLASLR